MKSLFTAGVLLLAGYTSQLAAGTVQCVPTQGCPKGSKPPACCQPPPCEYFEQIKMKKAVRRLFGLKSIKASLIRKAGGDNAAAAKLLNDWVADQAGKMGSQLRCPWKAPYDYAGTFETKSWCEIFRIEGKNQESMSEEQAQQKINTCSEFIEAIYVHEGNHKEICSHTNSTERANEGLTVYANEERASYRKEINTLKEKLQQYWRACSAVADAGTARRIAQAGVNTLKKKAPARKRRQADARPPPPAGEG